MAALDAFAELERRLAEQKVEEEERRRE